MSSSTAGALVSLGALSIYGYSMFLLTGQRKQGEMEALLPKPLRVHGPLKFLTMHTLAWQMVSCLLHVIAHFARPLRGARDFVFTTLAFPLGSVVVYSFWLIWLVMGREMIYPVQLDTVIPPWCNHAIHTIIAPVNIILAVVIYHKYLKNAAIVTLLYLTCYTIFLITIKAQGGLYVYPFLDKLTDPQRACYFAASGVFAYLMYKSGQLITRMAHGSEKTSTITKKPAAKSSKQR